jgi:pimeloyl-ACP methyl ester carboxylesterase
MTEPKHGNVTTNGIKVHYVEQGEGPLVVFCHGFPESWYSWRHQLPALASAGFRAVALDMRGYGGTSKPEPISAYTISHMVGDVVGTVQALGEKQATIVGHDWGAPVAWYAALMRPDLFRAAAVLSVPYTPPLALPPEIKLTDLMRQNAGPDREYYRVYFQEPGVAEAELEADVRRTMLSMLYGVSGDFVKDGNAKSPPDGHFPRGKGFLDTVSVPSKLPTWLTEADVEFFVKELSASGFRGGLNWYRNIDALPGILSPYLGRTIQQPTMYLYGELDQIAGNTPEAVEGMQKTLPNLKKVVKLEGAGHWLQQERPEEVNRELIAFLKSL